LFAKSISNFGSSKRTSDDSAGTLREPKMSAIHVYTSESVSEGHPDKLADQISDALLDAFLQEARAYDACNGDGTHHLDSVRVAIETLLTRGLCIVAGEVRLPQGYVDIQKVVRDTINDVGYTDTDLGFDGNTCGVLIGIQEQSAHIALGVDTGGAGDQGMMFGMATNETPEMMPLPLSIAHALIRQAVDVRKKHPSLGLRPDAKSQVSVIYEGHTPRRIATIVMSHQHAPTLGQEAVEHLLRERVIDPVLQTYSRYVDGPIEFHINPTGKFEIGGPQGDTGVTGRKIIVDTYGGMCPHGGGAFSGKDPTKVDRSAAYMARHLAKCVVAAGLADQCTIGLAYAIGIAQPVSLNIETFGTERADLVDIDRRIRANFDMSPRGLIDHLGLLQVPLLERPGDPYARVIQEGLRYRATASNGHFGNPAFPWERTSDAERLR
jgi:S-adenosylmethionine synthetase